MDLVIPALAGAFLRLRAEMEGSLIQRSIDEQSFRQRLLEDPRSVVEEDFGTRFPKGSQVWAVEETAKTI